MLTVSPVPKVIELYRPLAVGIFLWDQFAVPVLFSVFWLVLFVVQLCSNTMSGNAVGYQGILFFLLTRCDHMQHAYLTMCVGLFIIWLCIPSVSLNVVPRRTHFWVWHSLCRISLWDCSIYASSTWEVMLLSRMRMSCTGRTYITIHINCVEINVNPLLALSQAVSKGNRSVCVWLYFGTVLHHI